MSFAGDDSLLVARPVGSMTCFDTVHLAPAVHRDEGPCLAVQLAGPFAVERGGSRVIATTRRVEQRTAIDSVNLETGQVVSVLEAPGTRFYDPVLGSDGVVTAVAVEDGGLGPDRKTAQLVQPGAVPSEPVVRPSSNLLPVHLAAAPGRADLVLAAEDPGDSDGRRRVYALTGAAPTLLVDDAANSGLSISTVGTMAWSTKQGSHQAIVVERVDLP